MKTKNFLIPDGIEYYMPPEAEKFEQLKYKILGIYKKYKYKYVIPPIFDNLDNLLNLKSKDLDNETIIISNNETGSNIGIRADITPQISKIDYQSLKANDSSRFSYMGDIMRPSSKIFERKNPYQIGAEYFGKLDKKVDIEIIKLMIDIISLSKEKKIIVELGDLSFINNLLSSLDISYQNKLQLIDLINLKSKTEIKEFFSKYNLSSKKLIFLLELLDLSGDIKILKELKSVINKFKMDNLSKLNDLSFISNAIHKFKNSSEVHIDLCELHGFEYQTSIIYSVYLPNLRHEIARGGRYDAYGLTNGAIRTATGFSLDLKDILNLSIGKKDSYV